MKIVQRLNFFLRLIAFVLPMLYSQLASATVEPPDVLIKRASAEVIAAVKADSEIRKGNRVRMALLVQRTIAPNSAFVRMTALAVGQHWRTATLNQQMRLTEEFSSLPVHTYSGALAQASDQQIEIRQIRGDNAEVEVLTDVHSWRGKKPVRLSYKLAQSAKG